MEIRLTLSFCQLRITDSHITAKTEVVTAFTGVLELSRRNKITVEQKEIFGDILVEKRKRQPEGIVSEIPSDLFDE